MDNLDNNFKVYTENEARIIIIHIINGIKYHNVDSKFLDINSIRFIDNKLNLSKLIRNNNLKVEEFESSSYKYKEIEDVKNIGIFLHKLLTGTELDYTKKITNSSYGNLNSHVLHLIKICFYNNICKLNQILEHYWFTHDENCNIIDKSIYDKSTYLIDYIYKKENNNTDIKLKTYDKELHIPLPSNECCDIIRDALLHFGYIVIKNNKLEYNVCYFKGEALLVIDPIDDNSSNLQYTLLSGNSNDFEIFFQNICDELSGIFN